MDRSHAEKRGLHGCLTMAAAMLCDSRNTRHSKQASRLSACQNTYCTNNHLLRQLPDSQWPIQR